MSFSLNFKPVLGILALSSIFFFTGNSTVAQTRIAQSRFPTTFHCIRQRDSSLVTVARRGNRQTSPLFIWKSNNWGSKYPPQKRCKIVGQRLTKAVAANGGKLSGLYMTHGIVNKYPVICHTDDLYGGCTSKNILLTLPLSEKPVEKRNEILRSIANFSQKGTSAAITRSCKSCPITVDMEEVDDAFQDSTVNESSSNQTSPNQPINPTPKTVPSLQAPEEDMSI